MRRDIRLMSDAGMLSISSNKNVLPPFGVNGGFPGASNDFFVVRDGKELAPSDTPGKVSGFRLRRNDVISVRTSGGGGWGDALERDPRKVLADVDDGYLTTALARDMFGVVIKSGKVANAPTTALRKKMGKAQTRLVLRTFPEPTTHERRYCELAPQVMKRLGVSDGAAVEIEAPQGPVLRAWVRRTRDLSPGTIRIGSLASDILRVRPGQRVSVRRLVRTGRRSGGV
jgi:hypothetical protein